MEDLKALEREERMNKAKRNLMLAEAAYEIAEREYDEINQLRESYNGDLHFEANLARHRRRMERASEELKQARKAVSIATVDPDVIEKAADALTRGFI